MELESYCLEYKDIQDMIRGKVPYPKGMNLLVEGDHPLDGGIIRFVTKTGFIGVCQTQMSEGWGVGTITFRMGFMSGNTVTWGADKYVLSGIKDEDVCIITDLFWKTFERLDDAEAEKKMINLVKYPKVNAAIQLLEAKDMPMELIHATKKVTKKKK